LWQAETNSRIRIGQLSTEFRYGNYSRGWFNQYFWDDQRYWIWSSAPSGVVAYDIHTGAETIYLINCPQVCWTESRFIFSEDLSKMVVYSIAQHGTGDEGAITIYDMGTMTPVSVNVEGFGAPNIPYADYHPIALSAYNRYLVIGYDALRVWDIQNLPDAIDER
jgi:hypothetical protein